MVVSCWDVTDKLVNMLAVPLLPLSRCRYSTLLILRENSVPKRHFKLYNYSHRKLCKWTSFTDIYFDKIHFCRKFFIIRITVTSSNVVNGPEFSGSNGIPSRIGRDYCQQLQSSYEEHFPEQRNSFWNLWIFSRPQESISNVLKNLWIYF